MEQLLQKADSLNLNQIKRHIFICCGSKCCQNPDGLASWEYLKTRLKELGLSESDGIYHSKANCLRVCTQGLASLQDDLGL